MYCLWSGKKGLTGQFLQMAVRKKLITIVFIDQEDRNLMDIVLKMEHSILHQKNAFWRQKTEFPVELRPMK